MDNLSVHCIHFHAKLKYAHILSYPQCLITGLSFKAVLDAGHNSAVIGTNRRVKGRGTCCLETTCCLHTAAPQLPQGVPTVSPKDPVPKNLTHGCYLMIGERLSAKLPPPSQSIRHFGLCCVALMIFNLYIYFMCRVV